MAQEIPGVEHYQSMTSGFELPSDPRPASETAIREREKAINEGRLHAPSRSAIRKALEDIFKPAAEPKPVEIPLLEISQGVALLSEQIAKLSEEIRSLFAPVTKWHEVSERKGIDPGFGVPIDHGSQTPVDRIDLKPTITCADPA